MANFIAHASVFIFYFLFPDRLDLLSLVIGAEMIDAEYIPIFLRRLFKYRNLRKAFMLDPSICHSIIGGLVISMPMAVIAAYLLNPFFGFTNNIPMMLFSATIGVISHLILDIPTHKIQPIFWPFKVWKQNPIMFFKGFQSFQFLNYYRLFETTKNEYLATFNWSFFSNIFIIVAIAIYFMVN